MCHKQVPIVMTISYLQGLNHIVDITIFVFLEDFHSPTLNSPGGSSTSSRDGSPSRDISPITGKVKAPIFMKKGQRGYGFTLRAIRVYHGNSDVYTLHHHVVVSTIHCYRMPLLINSSFDKHLFTE